MFGRKKLEEKDKVTLNMPRVVLGETDIEVILKRIEEKLDKLLGD